MHRNVASRRPPRSAGRRRRRASASSSSSQQNARGAAGNRSIWTTPQVLMLSCIILTVLVYYNSSVNPITSVGSGGGDGGGDGRGGGNGGRASIEEHPRGGGVELLGRNGTALSERERWQYEAGWGEVPLDDLEEWAPLGPDPIGCLPRTTANPAGQPKVLVGWGFGAPKLTLYGYRALESIMHVYPGARVRVITVGPRYAFFYKWANILALTQFQKYTKRGYDVKVEIYFGKALASVKMNGRMIPGHKWWRRHEDTLLYGQGMKIATFQAVQEAVPDAYVTVYLALLELYKFGGIYVDLTTFFVRPLPTGVDGFVAGGEGPGSAGAGGGAGGDGSDCSAPTSKDRLHRPLVMQYRAPQHPVVECVLSEYDLEVSAMNECIALSKNDGYGGINCVLEALETCTENRGLTNDLREAGVVAWHGCNSATAKSYTTPSRSGASGSDILEGLTGIPPPVTHSPPPESGSETASSNGSMPPGESDITANEQGRQVSSIEARNDLLSPSSEDDDDDLGEPATSKGNSEGVKRGSRDDKTGGKAGTTDEEREGQGLPLAVAASATEDDETGEPEMLARAAAKEFVGVLAEAGIGAEGEGLEERSEDDDDAVFRVGEKRPDDDKGEGGEGVVGVGVRASDDADDELGEAGQGGGAGGGGAAAGLRGSADDDGGGDSNETEGGGAGRRAAGLRGSADDDGGDVAEGHSESSAATSAEKDGEQAEEGDGLGSRASSTEVKQVGQRIRARRRRLDGLAPGDASLAAGGAAADARALVATTPTGGGDADRVSLLWMGPSASDGLWREPGEGSLWAEAFSRLRLTKWKPQHVSESCRIPCGHWNTASLPDGKSGALPPILAREQAAFQCAPSVFVPGTQKGASTFLFHAISWHPQMVQPLRGAHGFKETGRYSPGVALGANKLGLRLAAFPFIEEHENFATGDGSVVYMIQNMDVPEAILADNPHAKIVFALRDPVARAWSDFRFLWNVYSRTNGFPSVVRDSVRRTRDCFGGHMGESHSHKPFEFGDGGAGQLTLSEEDEKALKYFYNSSGTCGTSNDPGHIIRKGIYYFQVLHWIRVFGRDNVMVVDSADLKSRQKETIEEVYRFLGLCPVDVSRLEPENVTPPPNIPDHKKINAESFKALQDFYEPFNKKLYNLLGRDLGWEKNTFKAR